MSSLQPKKARINHNRIPLLVLFVTPAHIQLLDEPAGPDVRGAFIPNLLCQAFESANPWQQYHVMAAVVDRIPYQSSTAEDEQPEDPSTASETVPILSSKDGFEGIAVAILDSETAAPDLWSLREEFKERDTMTIQQRCTISFALPPSPVEDLSQMLQPKKQNFVSRVLQLPVANTLFQNGKTSTMFAQHWTLRRRGELILEVLNSKKTWLPQQTLHMQNAFMGQDTNFDHSSHSYLTQITPARRINAAMGNIIRRVSVDNNSEESVPASEELEKAISQGVKSGQIPAQQAGVWALVRPHRDATLYLLPDQTQDPTKDAIGQAVLSGCRLHKVLSGGGGWGEKQGLLALDPDVDYSLSKQAWQPFSEDGLNPEAEKALVLGEIVKPGYDVTFYIYQSPPFSGAAANSLQVASSAIGSGLRTLSFGSLPSTMDSMPVTTKIDGSPEIQPDHKVIEDHFGMLSEQGMSLEVSPQKLCNPYSIADSSAVNVHEDRC